MIESGYHGGLIAMAWHERTTHCTMRWSHTLTVALQFFFIPFSHPLWTRHIFFVARRADQNGLRTLTCGAAYTGGRIVQKDWSPVYYGEAGRSVCVRARVREGRGSERLLCIAGRSWDVPLIMMRLPLYSTINTN